MLAQANRFLVVWLSSGIAVLGAGTALSKGLDTLKPEVEDAEAEDDAASDDEIEGQDASAPTTGAKAKTKDAKGKEAKAKAATATAAPMEQSATSKKLTGKLYIATGLGYVTITQDGNSWNKGGAGDVSIGYMITDKAIKKTKLFGTMRYAPIDVVPVLDKQSYRGVVEGYHFGVLGQFKVNQRVSANATAEIGYLVGRLHSIDSFAEDDAAEEAGVNFTLGGGADWNVLEKVTVGPKLYVGFGQYQVVQVAVNAGFIF